MMLRVTDMYGPIPYSKVGEGDTDNVPFDDVKSIYYTMFTELKSSVAELERFILESNVGTNHPMADFDRLYDGDFKKWISFANSLSMRMAMRISAVDEAFAKEQFMNALNAGPINSNADNALIPTEDNPYRKASVDWGDLAISASLSAFMNGFEDPRRPKYMTGVDIGEFRGVRMGIPNIRKQIYSQGSMYSKPAFEKNTALPVFVAAETAFLKAEAALKNWIAGGTTAAKGFYEEGISLSMAQHAVGLGDYNKGEKVPEIYMDPSSFAFGAEVPNKITVNWDDAGANENTHLEKIITQKWLANFPYGMESWADYRRTGFPQLFVAASNLSSSSFIGSIDNKAGRMVRRLAYPQSQYRINGPNVQEGVRLLGGDDVGSTDLWWAKKN